MVKLFFLCVFLNLVGYFTMTGLAGTTQSPHLSVMYSIFGFMLILTSDIMFISRLIKSVRKSK